jgi:hypothetical protein
MCFVQSVDWKSRCLIEFMPSIKLIVTNIESIINVVGIASFGEVGALTVEYFKMLLLTRIQETEEFKALSEEKKAKVLAIIDEEVGKHDQVAMFLNPFFLKRLTKKIKEIAKEP